MLVVSALYWQTRQETRGGEGAMVVASALTGVPSAFERGDLNGQIWKPGCMQSKARERLPGPADRRGAPLGGEWPSMAVLLALVVLRKVARVWPSAHSL